MTDAKIQNKYRFDKTKKCLQFLASICLLVGPGRIELPLPKKPDFESGASTSSATTPSTKIVITIFIFIRQ